jgi:hypothetical protein
MLLDVLLQINVAKSGPRQVLLGKSLQPGEKLFCFDINSIEML